MSSDEDEDELPPWTFESAKSGRSKCKACSLQITQGEARVGHRERHSRRGFDFYVWFHIGCSDVGYCETPDKCEFCFKKMKESELTLTVESSFSDMVATVHLQCAALKARDGTVVVDPSEFGLYDELSHSDQQTAISLFDAENIDGGGDSDDAEQTVEVVEGGTAGAAAVAGSTFLGYDLQQAEDQFRSAEANGLVVDLGSSSDEEGDAGDSKVVSPGVEGMSIAELKDDLVVSVDVVFGGVGKHEPGVKGEKLGRIKSVLNALQNANMTVDILQSTKIGIAVNKCKSKCKRNPELQAAMGKLVRRWKEIFLTSQAKAKAEKNNKVEGNGPGNESCDDESDSDADVVITHKKVKSRFIIPDEDDDDEESDSDDSDDVVFLGSSQPATAATAPAAPRENVPTKSPSPSPNVRARAATRSSSRPVVAPQPTSRPTTRPAAKKRKAPRKKTKPRKKRRKKKSTPKKKKAAPKTKAAARRVINSIKKGKKQKTSGVKRRTPVKKSV